MLNKSSVLISVLLIVSVSICHAENVSNISIDETAACSSQTLYLNGTGVREKLFIKLYVAALYTQTKNSDEKQLLNMSQKLCMRLYITSSKITSEKMIKVTREGFEQSTQGNTASITNEMEIFLTWLKQPIKKGDIFEFSFVPNNKTQVSKNDQFLGEINSQKFDSALFGIWLGNHPVQHDLKNKLLGK